MCKRQTMIRAIGISPTWNAGFRLDQKRVDSGQWTMNPRGNESDAW